MARINLCVVGQMEQALDDVRAELLVVATGEVGAADATAKEGVASEDPTFHHSIKTNAAHGMTWRADDLKGALPYLDDFAIFKVTVRQLTLAIKRQPKHLRLLMRPLEIAFHIGMRRHLDAITLFHCCIAYNMVDMAMCIDGH